MERDWSIALKQTLWSESNEGLSCLMRFTPVKV